MISNQVLQNTLEGLKEISRIEFCIIDTEGKVLASTFSDFSVQAQDVQAFVESQADSQLVKGFQYCTEKNIIRLWNDLLLNYNFNTLISQEKKNSKIFGAKFYDDITE